MSLQPAEDELSTPGGVASRLFLDREAAGPPGAAVPTQRSGGDAHTSTLVGRPTPGAAAETLAREAVLWAQQVQAQTDAARSAVVTAARRAVLLAMASSDPVERARVRALAASAGLAAEAAERDSLRAAAAVASAEAAYAEKQTSVSRERAVDGSK